MKDLWKSKKFKAAVLNTLIGSAALIARSKGYDLSNTEIAVLMTPLSAYILGQGMADWGKESGKKPEK